jgi:hypothetical protein
MLYSIAGVLAWMGAVYFFAPTIMPYHERYLGVKHDDLDPAVASLILYMMKDMGIGFLTAAISIAMLVRVPFRRAEPWAWWTLLAVATVVLGPLLWITLSIGLYTPWRLVVIGIISTAAALLIAGVPSRGR